MSSSTTTTPAAAAASVVPVEIAPRVRERLLAKVASSTVTIVVGPTGSGKSTRVPALLLDDLVGRDGAVLCTQPRRLAVVAVSGRVARERGSVVGGEVGYHVGQSRVASSGTKTRLLFATAGVVLEEMRANGPEAVLTRYAVVVVDECHERSPESDLLLATVRSFLTDHHRRRGGGARGRRRPVARLVLMSATFDHERYRTYFADATANDDDRIDVVHLETGDSFDAFHERVSDLYLDDACRLYPDLSRPHERFLRVMRQRPDDDLAGDDRDGRLSLGLLGFCRALLANLHRDEPPGRSFLVFAPTYAQLEQCYHFFKNVQHNGRAIEISVLHSAIDTEDCLRFLTSRSSSSSTPRFRRVFLASAVAESSVTIPDVSVVIDLGRSLRREWCPLTGRYRSRTAWSSRSVCDQRRGRTGRTCPGRVFRILTKYHYTTLLEPWEQPTLARSSCRDEILGSLCSRSAVDGGDDHARPLRLLERCLDPPPAEVARQAAAWLTDAGACALSPRGRLRPTRYGRLLAGLSFAVEDARRVVAGARLGLLHETLALQIIFSHKPAPIAHVFGDDGGATNQRIHESFYPDVDMDDPFSVRVANLAAYLCWELEWRARRARDARSSDDRDPWRWTDETNESHVEWCQQHHINPTSVRAIEELADHTRNVLFHVDHEPDWLRCVDPTPPWRRREYDDDDDGTRGTNDDNNDDDADAERPKHIICPVCLEVPHPSDLASIDGCYHLFCHSCIVRWRDENGTCPLCKAEFHVVTRRGGGAAAAAAASDGGAESRRWNQDRYYFDSYSDFRDRYDDHDVFRSDTRRRHTLRRLYGVVDQGLLYKALSALFSRACDPREAAKAARAFRGLDDDDDDHDDDRPLACVHFLLGQCDFGDECRNSHDPSARRPLCRFFARGGCERGNACVYSHESPSPRRRTTTMTNVDDGDPLSAAAPTTSFPPPSPREWTIAAAGGLLILGDDDRFSLASSLTRAGLPPVASVSRDGTVQARGRDRRGDEGRDALLTGSPSSRPPPRSFARRFPIARVLWSLPCDDESDENDDGTSLARGLRDVAAWFHPDDDDASTPPTTTTASLGLILRENQFFRKRVLRSAERAGWRLKQWGPFDETDFPGYRRPASRERVEPLVDARFYAFETTPR